MEITPLVSHARATAHRSGTPDLPSDITGLHRNITGVLAAYPVSCPCVKHDGCRNPRRRDVLRSSIWALEPGTGRERASKDTRYQASEDVATASNPRPRCRGCVHRRLVNAREFGQRVHTGAVTADIDRIDSIEIDVFVGVDDRHGTFQDDVAAGGLVERAGVAQGRCCDLSSRHRSPEESQESRGLAVMRGQDRYLRIHHAHELGNEVQRPRVDDKRHASLATELRELERVLTAVLVKAGPDEGRLDAPTDHDNARLSGQHEILDAPGRVEANHAHARGQRPMCCENTGTRVGVRSGDEADDAARVLVV